MCCSFNPHHTVSHLYPGAGLFFLKLLVIWIVSREYILRKQPELKSLRLDCFHLVQVVSDSSADKFCRGLATSRAFVNPAFPNFHSPRALPHSNFPTRSQMLRVR
ncbi:hypothetical protein BDR03DRAFT_729461 [Suillus americanus]|nr:hypothetical protein BDR03DRAFT_729461 [Suillus americanus]